MKNLLHYELSRRVKVQVRRSPWSQRIRLREAFRIMMKAGGGEIKGHFAELRLLDAPRGEAGEA